MPPMQGPGPLSRHTQASIRSYAVAVLAPAVALGIARWPIVHLESAPVSLFLCAVMLSAWLGGVGPGLLATVLSAAAFAYYASTNQKLDLTYWDYGYTWRPNWWNGWGRRWGRGWGGDWGIASGPVATQYTEGTVIVDVFDPKTKDLLWRGQGVAAVSDDEAQYEQELKKTVEAIVDKFPAAATKVALAQ